MAFELPAIPSSVISPQSTLAKEPTSSAPNLSFNPGANVDTNIAQVALEKQRLQMQQNQQNTDNILRTVKMASDLAQSFVEASKLRQQKDAVAAYAAMQPNQKLAPVMKAFPQDTAAAILRTNFPTTLQGIATNQVLSGQTTLPAAAEAIQKPIKPTITTIVGPDGKSQVVTVNPKTSAPTVVGEAVPKTSGTGAGKVIEQQFPDGSIHNMEKLPEGGYKDVGIKKLSPGSTPTTQDINTAHFAMSVVPHIAELRDMISQAEAKGYIGPTAGRIYQKFLVGGVGKTGNDDADKLLGDLKSTASMIASGALRTHFGARGGQQMYEHFTKNLDTTTQSKSLLNGELDSLESFLKGYSKLGQSGMGTPTPAGDNTQEILDALRSALPKRK